MRAWLAAKRVEAVRLVKSHSTYVVGIGMAAPQLWAAVPARFQEGVFAVLPFMRAVDWILWMGVVGVAFWKARNTPQTIPPLLTKT